MADPRIAALADILIRYSIDLQPRTNTGDSGLYAGRAAHAGALSPRPRSRSLPVYPGRSARRGRILLRYGNDDQLQQTSPFTRHILENFDSRILIVAPENTRALTGIDPARVNLVNQANREWRG